jgi:hypothetical protein
MNGAQTFENTPRLADSPDIVKDLVEFGNAEDLINLRIKDRPMSQGVPFMSDLYLNERAKRSMKIK